MSVILVKKTVPHNVARPLVHFVLCYILGIIGGNIFLHKKYVSLFVYFLIVFISMLVYAFYYSLKDMMGLLISLGIGLFIFVAMPLHQESKLFKANQIYELEGQIDSVKITEYYKWVTLKSVEVPTLEKKLKSRIQLRLSLTQQVSPYDYIKVEAEKLEIEPQMNPSDFDYALYLKGEKVAATFKAEKIVSYNIQTSIIEKAQNSLNRQLEKVFSSEKVGIMEAALLGDDTKLNEYTKSLYQNAGISHVLCISGFHVGVVIGVFSYLLSCFIMPYTLKQVMMIIAIWGYALITGCETSTVRATIMVTIGLVGRCMWQEEDGITSLAIAALVILLQNPYQLFMVGFQLSFMAVLGIILCNGEIEKKELEVEWKYPKWQCTLMIWASVQLFTWPVIAYHFYEIAFLLSLVNLIIIPIFSLIIIGGWCALIGSFILLPIALLLSQSIEMILIGIEQVVEFLVKLPLAHLCTGKPSMGEIALYSIAVLLIGAVVWGYCTIWRFYQGIFLILCLYTSSLIMKPQNLRMTYLYIGQGDCMVMEMPQKGLFVLDGGNFGKGKVLENYIKYLGYSEVQGVMVSHSDADHIGGILELLDTSISVKQVFVSETDESEHLTTLVEKCKRSKIPIYRLEQGENFKYGQLMMECLAPGGNKSYEDANDNSLVCRLSYGKFSALFTGDKSKESDIKLYDTMEPVTLLKVSHHGSRTGTSKELLLKLHPRYAMISCGRANRYGHPHQEVLTLLEEAKVTVNRTDQEGAIIYETDGTHLKETTYRKDA
ncbi:MAG: DNA internalization-related competence protein ComEC/Rec2 [Cellulosilyticum sp.]|nr:DNA internalization-related competence protein ComEC/Rec2 [Cellulosilyticum sp.]